MSAAAPPRLTSTEESGDVEEMASQFLTLGLLLRRRDAARFDALLRHLAAPEAESALPSFASGHPVWAAFDEALARERKREARETDDGPTGG